MVVVAEGCRIRRSFPYPVGQAGALSVPVAGPIPVLPIILLALALSLPVAAEPIPEISVTSLRTPVPESELIGNISVLDQSQLELVGATHIQQSLARLPGVNLHHNSGQEYLPAIRSPVLSGAGACGSFLMAEDGIPLRPAGFCNVNELFEAHTEQAVRIEVIRGPGAALYGSNALHGVVNVITPGVPADSAASAPESNRVALDYGSLDFYRTRIRAGADNVSVAVTGTRDGGFRDNAGVDQQKLSARHRYSTNLLSITTGVTAVNLNQETAGFIDGTDSYRDSGLAESNPNPEAYRDAKALRLWSRFEDNRDQPSWVVTPYVRWSQMAFLQHFLPGTPLEENGQRSAGMQTAWYFTRERSRTIVGVDSELVRGWLRQSQDSPTQGSDFLRETLPVGNHYDFVVNATQLAPFVHWDWQASNRWNISLGLRFEWMRYDYDNRMLDGRTRDDGSDCGFGGCRYSRPPDSIDNFLNLSPKLGVSYSLARDQQLFLSMARGFRAPQAVELYRLQRDQRVANLDSERLDSLEVGVRDSGEGLRYELVAYAMRKSNLIFRDSSFFNVDSGRTRHYGLELSLEYPLADNLVLGLAATIARHRYGYHEILSGIDIEGNDVDTAPHRFGTLNLTWQPTDTSQLELEWLHMGSYYTDPENLHGYDGHDLLNLRGAWQLSPKLALNARVTNLLDRPYADRADYTSFSGDRYMPGEPRGVFMGIEYRWLQE